MELASFLAEKPEDSLIALNELRATGEATVELSCAVPDSWGIAAGTCVVRAQGVVESQLNVSLPYQVPLRVSSSHPLLWDYGGYSSIFGNAPLPDPPRFFHEFYQLVRSDLGVPRDPVRYLNWKEHLGEWLEFVYSRTYQLLSAPAPIAEAATELLEVQAAEYTILADPPSEQMASFEALLAVVLGDDSWLICQGAEVVD